MRKRRLKLVIFGLAFTLIFAMQYAGEAIPRGIGDVLGFFAVMIVLTALETDVLRCAHTHLIPRCFKTVIGVIMLLGLANVIKQFGWVRASYFNEVIILQFPITLIDVSFLVVVGTTLYWTGGLMYDTITKLTIAIGNISYSVAKRVGLLELEDDDEDAVI